MSVQLAIALSAGCGIVHFDASAKWAHVVLRDECHRGCDDSLFSIFKLLENHELDNTEMSLKCLKEVRNNVMNVS